MKKNYKAFMDGDLLVETWDGKDGRTITQITDTFMDPDFSEDDDSEKIDDELWAIMNSDA